MQKALRNYVGHHEKKVRFLIAGCVNTLVGLSVYPILFILLKPIGFGYMEVLFLAQLICITFSFISNKYFVFKTKGNIKKEYVKFFMFYGFYLAVNVICLPVMVEVIKITPIVAQTLFSIAIIVTSYFWHNFITFKQPKESI